VDVNIYASGNEAAEKLRGNHEKTEIGRFIEEYLELDLESITKLLNSGYALLDSADGRAESWMHGDGAELFHIQGAEFGVRYH